ncbi:MAG: M23 family metallopeptidase [Clostridia bacterium]|nr:M23 family metallopeptidase [Clostridia bacterium]
MNEKLQYATMLEIPVSTCSVSSVKQKKKRFARKKKVNDEQIKEQLLNKINSEEIAEGQTVLEDHYIEEQSQLQETQTDFEQVESTANVYSSKPKKKRFAFNIVGVQLAIIGVLIGAIFLTNAVYEDSGINVFLRNVFGMESSAVDTREFDDFTPVINMGDNYNLSLENGVITFAGEGSVYSACDGVVQSVIKGEDDKYTLEIAHSENFKSIISGVERVYVKEGDMVKAKIPVGYLEPDGATMCFMGSSGEIIEDYQIANDTVVWAE